MKLIKTLCLPWLATTSSAILLLSCCCNGFGEKRMGTTTKTILRMVPSPLHVNSLTTFIPATRISNIWTNNNNKDASVKASARTTGFKTSTDLLLSRRGGVGNTSTAATTKLTRWQKFAQNLFDETDVNNDGSVSFEEAYALVLQLYVKINRQAPIPPPTRAKFLKQYKKADRTQNNSLDKSEFTNLVGVITNRALWRVSCVKITKIVGAPLLAELIIRTLAGKKWLTSLITKIVPTRFHDTILPVLTSTSFWRPVVLIALVISLGKVVLNIVNFFLDLASPDQDDE